jgi:hypothetical protein
MAAATPVVDVIGLRALAKDIERAGDVASPLNVVLQEAGRAAAAPVGAAAQSALPAVETTEHEAGTMAGNVRLYTTRTGAGIRMGSARLPYAGPLEFGAWPEGREFIPSGRYLFPAAGRLAAESAQLYSEALERGFAAFPWTNQGDAPHD